MPLAIAHVTDRAEAHLPHWYAVRVRANREKAVSRDLLLAGIPEFLPLYTTESKWSDRTKTIERPLFPGYLFARATPRQFDRVTATRGVVQILSSSLQPTPIPDEEINAVRRLMDSPAMKLQPCDYTVGELVTVESGALAGQSGIVTRTKGTTRLVVNVVMLGRAVSVELDSDTVTRGTQDNKAAA